MKAARKFRTERRIDQAVGLDPILTTKGFCDNPHPKVGLALGTVAGVALVPVGLVDYLKCRRGKSLG